MTAEKTAEKLLEAVREGRYEEVPGLLEPLGEAERRACVPELKRLVAGLRDVSWRERDRLAAPYLAGAGCLTGAAAAAQWLMRREFWQVPDGDKLGVLEVFSAREPAWLGDVAHRMAAARAARVVEEYDVIAALAGRSGAAPPETDGFVRGWMLSHIYDVHGAQSAEILAQGLRADPFLPVLFPRMFEAENAGSITDLLREIWPQALARLVRDGVLDRKTTVDLCVAKLLRGDARQINLRFFRRLLAELALTEDESAARTADWVRIAADGHSTVAGDAQAELRRLWEAGRLAAEQFAEVTRSVLFRTEKKLLRAQLTLAGKALRRDPGTAAVLLPAVAEAFGHPDTDVQERALKLVERYVPVLESVPGVRRELSEQAGLLSPALRERAVRILGSGEPYETYQPYQPYEEVLPPVPAPRPLGPVPDSPDAVAREVAVLIRDRSADTPEKAEVQERALAGYARQAYRDLDALAEALRPLTERHPWLESDNPLQFLRVHGAFVVAALRPLNRRDKRELRGPEPSETKKGHAHAHFPYAFGRRLLELAERLRDDPPPQLLATPTWANGVLEPGELVARLREYAALGARAGRADFEQALLRVRPDPAYAPEAAALGTPEGRRLADWLESGGLAQPRSELINATMPGDPTRRDLGGQPLVALGAAPRLRREFAGAFAGLGGRYEGAQIGTFVNEVGTWSSVLPHHSETVAACLARWVAPVALSGARGRTAHLPVLAEAEGEAGLALHFSLAYAMGARYEEDRLAAVDALLVLAARGRLDAARLGDLAAGLVASGAVLPGRLADALGAAAATGACATVWSVLAAALPELLVALEAGRRIGPVLALAADCAERCGGGGAGIPGLAELASRGGSSQPVRQARRLREALGV